MPDTYISSAETGFYYLNSRYYDPEIGRFINAHREISGVGGDIRGYNMFSYCLNNPVNMEDPNGNWPKWLKEIGARAKYVAKFMIGVLISPIKAAKAEIGLGIGIGAKASGNIKGVKIDGGISTSITDFLSYDKGKFDIKNTTSTKVGITFSETLDFSYTAGKGHSFFDKECGCNILHDPFVEQSKCSANTKIRQSDMTAGFSLGAYLGLGAEVSAGIDLRAWYDELTIVLTEPYISPYY